MLTVEPTFPVGGIQVNLPSTTCPIFNVERYHPVIATGQTTMTLITVRQAADRTGVTRQTMYRLIESGKVSATVSPDGSKVIDTAELLRHFGTLQSPDTVQAEKSDGQRQSKRSHIPSTDTQLQIEIERLKAMLAAKDAEIALLRERVSELKDDKIAYVGFVERAQRLLEIPGKKRLWGLFGG